MSPLTSPRRPSAIRPRPAAARRGFTLIEILIVLSIIAILASLLLAGVFSAMRTARVTAVVADIKNLEKALVDFKQKYGVDVPSSIRLHETAANWTNPDNQTKRSRAILQRIWPQFDFTYNWNPNPTGLADGQLDINGDGNIDTTPIDLNGAECLVFFLGGMTLTYDNISKAAGTELEANRDDDKATPGNPPAAWTAIGFSPNPAFPFSRAGSTRAPIYEFDGARFVAGASNMPAYVDPIPGQTRPYVYASAVSSIRGSGYQTGDLTVTGATSLSTFYFHPTNSDPLNPKSYQLISPGFDFEYGTGGDYDGNAITAPGRAAERDNITNFRGGELGG